MNQDEYIKTFQIPNTPIQDYNWMKDSGCHWIQQAPPIGQQGQDMTLIEIKTNFIITLLIHLPYGVPHPFAHNFYPCRYDQLLTPATETVDYFDFVGLF